VSCGRISTLGGDSDTYEDGKSAASISWVRPVPDPRADRSVKHAMGMASVRCRLSTFCSLR